MNRPLFKRTVLAALSLVLLYYNVAWAVLRCPHQESHPDHEVVLYNVGFSIEQGSLPSSSHGQASLDCTGPKYHTELLAGPSTTSELRLARDVASRVSALVALSSLARDTPQEIRLKTLFIKSPSPIFDLPRYLSLSVLRF
jgi:hypothetical protein